MGGCLDQLQTATCHLPLREIKFWAAAAADLQYPLKRVQGGEQERSTLCSGKTGRTGLQKVRYFQKPNLWAHFSHLFLSRKALKSSMVTSAPHDQPWACWWPSPVLPPSPPQSHTHLPASHLFGAVSQSYLRCCLPDYSHHFAPDKV